MRSFFAAHAYNFLNVENKAVLAVRPSGRWAPCCGFAGPGLPSGCFSPCGAAGFTDHHRFTIFVDTYVGCHPRTFEGGYICFDTPQLITRGTHWGGTFVWKEGGYICKHVFYRKNKNIQ